MNPFDELKALRDELRGEAMAAVPPDYADRGLHHKYLNLDNEAAGKVDAADRLDTILSSVDVVDAGEIQVEQEMQLGEPTGCSIWEGVLYRGIDAPSGTYRALLIRGKGA